MCHGCVYTGSFELDYPRTLLAALYVHRIEIPYRAFPELVCYTAVFSVVTQCSSPQTAAKKPNYIPFPLSLWSNEQANHEQEV